MSEALTVLASPKPFLGEFARIQERALESWRRIHPSVELILYGNCPGVKEAAARHGASHVPTIGSSASGAPLFDAIARHAKEQARHERHIYLNADILLPPDLLARIALVPAVRCLISGERIDLAQDVQWDPSLNWQMQFDHLSRSGRAQPHGKTGMDYFIFPRGLWDGLQELIVGRGGYDNALLAFCLRRQIPVVDATPAVAILHQWHGFSHVPGGRAEVRQGQEAQLNRARHDLACAPPDIADADWVLGCDGLRAGDCRGDRLRALVVRLRYRYSLKLLSLCVHVLWKSSHSTAARIRSPS